MWVVGSAGIRGGRAGGAAVRLSWGAAPGWAAMVGTGVQVRGRSGMQGGGGLVAGAADVAWEV